MTQRYRPDLPLAILTPSVLISISTGVVGILTYTNNKEHLDQAGIISLVVGELFSVLALPFLIVRTDLSLISSIVITTISTLLSLGAGLYTLNTFVIFNTTSLSTPLLFKSFVSLFVVSMFFGGITLGSQIQNYHTGWEFEVGEFADVENEKKQKETSMNEDGRYRSDTVSSSLKEKMISLKASAATLIDTAGRNDDNITVSQSNKSRRSPKQTLASFSFKKNNSVTEQNMPDYSIKKLSVINQSSSSVNISECGSSNMPRSQSGNRIKSGLFTPTLSRFKDVESSSKIMMLERDALKRIPSVLLPPHLRPHTNNDGQQRRGSEQFQASSYSANDISNQYFREDHVMQQIPRAHTVDNLIPFSKDSQGIKTITLEDYENNHDRIQKNQLIGADIFQRQSFNSIPFYTPPSEEREDYVIDSEVGESIVESSSPGEADDSTDVALKYLANAQRASEDSEILKTAMDQTSSKINLQALESFDVSGLSKTKSHSPHKSISIFGHSRKGSQFSNKGNGASLPTSPMRGSKSRRSPRKMSIKNLSLSSIVYKDEKTSDVPNFSYVHELQSSPTKKSMRKDPFTPQMKARTVDVLKDKTNTTPDSIWSGSSHHSVFPSEVIGEYDKEKWKTMMRLQMVGQEHEQEHGAAEQENTEV